MFRSKQVNHRNGRGNLAARMGRWSAAHWKTATFGWVAFVLVAFALGGAVGAKSIDANAPGPGESGRMDRILDAGFEQPAGESVLVQSRTLRTTDPAFEAAITDVVSRLSKLNDVQNVRSPLDPGNTGQIAPGGHAALVEFEIRGDPDKAIDKIGPVLDTRRRPPGSSSGGLRRRVRRREQGRCARDGLRRRPREGRDALPADHTDHSRPGVRSPGGRGYPAAPGPDRRVRDVRAHRAAQRDLPGGDAGACAGAPRSASPSASTTRCST